MDAQPQNQISNPQNAQAVSRIKKDIYTKVLTKVEAFKETGELRIPADYSPENAIKAASLIIAETKNKDGKYALEVCSEESIANSLFKMIVWGLSPLKKQCDFIVYGNKLECSIEYTGNIALAKRYGGLKDIKPVTIFEGDIFEFEIDVTTGRKKILKHTQTLESIGSNKVKGAYAVMQMNDGTTDVEIMNITQIQAAWGQGGSKGNSVAHRNFTDQMANKTVINRATKPLIRSSDDSILFDNDDNGPIDSVKEDVSHHIRENANRETISFDTIEEAEVVEEKPMSESAIEARERLMNIEFNGADQTTIAGPGF